MTISIITVVYNGRDLLPGTIESVQRQTWPNIEYWIIDGGSTDGTLDVIKDYANKMPNLKWISEKDRGLYDAMNKGLERATGDFIQFLNGGDWLHAPDTVECLMKAVDHTTDVVYGETMLVDDSRQAAGLMSELSTRKIPDALRWQQYVGGMLVVHQSFIPRRTIAPVYEIGNLCADYDWCIQILKKSRKNVHSGIVITDYLMGGMSKKRHRQSLIDRFWVMRKHFGLFMTLLAHGQIVLRAGWHRLMRWGKPKY